jgi:hypothetical protein
VAEGQSRHVDAEQPDTPWAVGWEYGVGQLGIGHEGADFKEYAESQVADVDVGQGIDFGPVAGQQRQGHVEEEEEEEEGPHTETHFTPDEGPAVPPPPA